MDCRLETSKGLEDVSASITGHSGKHHQNQQDIAIDPKVHFCRYLIQKVVHDKLMLIGCQMSTRTIWGMTLCVYIQRIAGWQFVAQ